MRKRKKSIYRNVKEENDDQYNKKSYSRRLFYSFQYFKRLVPRWRAAQTDVIIFLLCAWNRMFNVKK